MSVCPSVSLCISTLKKSLMVKEAQKASTEGRKNESTQASTLDVILEGIHFVHL